MRELTDFEIDSIAGAGEVYDNAYTAGEKVGEAIEAVGDAIKDGWNKLTSFFK